MNLRPVFLIFLVLIATLATGGHIERGIQDQADCPACKLERVLGCGLIFLALPLGQFLAQFVGFLPLFREVIPIEVLRTAGSSPRSPPSS